MRDHTGAHGIERGADLAEKGTILRFQYTFEDIAATASGMRRSGSFRDTEFYTGIKSTVFLTEFEP